MFLVFMFFEQWMVLEILLYLMCVILKQPGFAGRIIGAGAAGSGLGCMILLLPQKIPFGNLFLFVPAVVLTVWIAFRPPMKNLFSFCGYLLAVAFFFGGIWMMLQGQIKGLGWIMGFMITMGMVLLVFRSLWNTLRQQKEFLYQVSFQWQGVTVKVCGFLDTGNFLYEPIGKVPVSVMEEAVFLEYFKEPLTIFIEKHSVKDIRMIPYHTVGKENGMMLGILVTKIQITNGNQKVEVKHGIVGISKKPLSERGHYQMLLHPDLIKCGRS